MARVINVRNSGGELVVLGEALVLPSDISSSSSPGSLRYNPSNDFVEYFDGNVWVALISNKLAVSLLGASNGIATLDESGRLPSSQLSGIVVGGVTFEGTWNAETNIPPLTSSVGVKGSFYLVSTNGSTNLDGNDNWLAGDLAVFDGSHWDRIQGLSSNAAAIAGAASLNSPTFTGNPITPTPAADDNSQSIANTAWVAAKRYISGNQPIVLSGVLTGNGTTSIIAGFSPIGGRTFLANPSPVSTAPVQTTLSTFLDSVVGNVPGSLLCRDETGWTILPPGAAQSVLQGGDEVQWGDAVLSFNGRTGTLTLTSQDVTDALGFSPAARVNGVSPDENGGIDFSVVGTFNGRPGAVTLTSQDVTQALGYTPLQQSATGLSVSFGGSALCSPYLPSQILTRIAMGFPVTLPKNLPNSVAVCLTAATKAVGLTISKNGMAIGSIMFASGATTGSFSFSGDVSFDIGDILQLDAPNPADATFGNLTFTIVGYR